VVDTHAMYWYLKRPDRLSAPAETVFRLAVSGNANIVIPAIVVSELYYLFMKLGLQFHPEEFFETLDLHGNVSVSQLGRAQLEKLDIPDDVPEMHDRLIAAEAYLLNAPIITRDAAITNSRHTVTIW
jgi:PIN domain nuclease of toxin-antitoxin system